MKKEIFKYIKKNFSQKPSSIDRLVVSSFLQINNLHVQRNKFLKTFLITKENHDERISLGLFIAYLKKQSFTFDCEVLVELFEFVISPEDKIVTGAVYTPRNVRETITDEVFSIHKPVNIDMKICDMACGCGGFLYTAAKKLKSITQESYSTIFRKNIYGLDIKDYSITRTKILLSLLALSEGEDVADFKFNLYKGNALKFNWRKIRDLSSGFDIVVGNPPYVCSRNIDEKSRKLLIKWSVCSSGHPDLYIPFFQIGLEYLKPAGVLGFITMNTFFKSLNGRALREYFQQAKYKFKIIDFGSKQVFHTKFTYTCICLIQKTNDIALHYAKVINTESPRGKYASFNIIQYDALDSRNGWNLQNTELINQIEATGISFDNRYETRSGIATLKNHIYIFDPIEEDEKYFYLRNGNTYKIEKDICKEIVNTNKLIKVNEITALKKKIIFPYYFDGVFAKLIPEIEFQEKYPMAYRYLQDKDDILAKRDKGNGNYGSWYAYGRNQSLVKLGNKLLFPHITPVIPNYVINTDENLLFHNGLAAICDDLNELIILKKIMSSRLFWFYIVNTSKPYGSGYFSLSRNYIKKFGIYNFTDEDRNFLLKEDNLETLNSFFEKKYEIKLHEK